MDTPAEETLDQHSARLMTAFAPETFARQASAATELVLAHLAAAADGERPVWPGESPDAVLDAWPDPTVGPPISLARLLEDFISASTAQHHPGFVGQQLSSPPPLVGPLALVSTVLNNSAATFEGAPAAVAMERRLVSWMNRKAGYDERAAGIITSGGSLGALTALLAMRQAKCGDDVWRDGVQASPPAAVLMSSEAHYCNHRPCAVARARFARDLANAFADEIARRAAFELRVRPESNIVCFRRRAPGDADALQLRLRETVNRSGRFFIMKTTLAGATWLRVVLMNPATRLCHLRELLNELEGAG